MERMGQNPEVGEFAGDTPATTAKRKNSAASDGGSYSDCTKAIGSPLAI
jgi:hypothetical protein